MKTLKVYTCFISSPSDCAKEREKCEEVIESINNGLARHLGICFKSIMWENDILPDFGASPQSIIDSQVPNTSYDLYIGILKSRFGTPTDKAGSGTEHEFLNALDRKRKSEENGPQILMFFGQENINPYEIDLDQFKKVKNFKESLKDKGLFTEFSNLEEFEDSLVKSLQLFIENNSPLDKPKERINELDMINSKLKIELDDSLKTYNERSPIWIDPILSTKRDIPNSPNKNKKYKVEISTLLESPEDTIIKAPSEFGLTSLAHYLKLKAWELGKAFLYLDVRKTKKHKILKDIERLAKDYFFREANQLDCLMIDSVCFEEFGVMKKLKVVTEELNGIPIIIFNTLDNSYFLKSKEADTVEINRSFQSLYLLPLPQNELRKLVNSYARFKEIKEDNDVILTKVTKDFRINGLNPKT